MPSLLSLKQLRYLDLSMNNFEFISIPAFVGSLHHLRYLNFSGAGFGGVLPKQFGNLTRLEYFDLDGVMSAFHFNAIRVDGNLDWISQFYSLKYLNMNFVKFGKEFPILQILNKIPSITEIHLAGCHAQIPLNFPYLNFSSVTLLDLYQNNLSNPAPIPCWLFNISSLQYLDLGSNEFSGNIPSSMENLTMLKYLNLSYNVNLELQSLVPASIGKLCQLETLNLQGLNISKDLSELVGIFGGCIKTSIEYLDLAYTNVEGQLPEWLWSLKKLKTLDLHYNKITGFLPTSIGKLSSLEFLDLASNEMNGAIPEVIDRLSNLAAIDLSHNNFSGKLPDLTILGNLQYLYMDSNSFLGPLPHLPPSLMKLHLRNNQFGGRIPHLPSSLVWLDLSNNKFSGRIPLLHGQNLEVVDLSRNHLFGELPDYWNSSSNIQIVDFSNNLLSGVIPESIGNLPNLYWLILNSNKLSGTLPSSLSMCKHLEIVDVGNNNLSGEIPSWIGESLTKLRILKLGSNMLKGSIPLNLPGATNLHILDLGSNDLSGTIPKSFKSFAVMKDGNYNSSIFIDIINERITVATKGKNLPYGFDELLFAISMDLSNNHLSGDIPKEITSLVGLENLNLSGNNLIGEIPTEIGNLKNLESLDLSLNNLSGRIPSSINSLSSLGFLNLSYNDLSGEIPQGTQMMTFGDSFKGNPRLCGLPLDNKCKTNETSDIDTKKAEDEETNGMIWFYISMGPGFAVGFWVVWGTLLLKRKWKDSYFYFIDNSLDRIYVFLVVKFSLIERRN